MKRGIIFVALGIGACAAWLPPAALGSQTLTGHVPEAVARLHLPPSGRLPATNILRLAVGLPLRNTQALHQLLQGLYDPASPDYHHFLTAAEFAGRFGPSPEDCQAVSNFFSGSGLDVINTHPNREIVDVEGSVADIEKTLHLTLRTYRHPSEQRDFFAPDAEPVLGTDVPVLHIAGLDNYVIPRPMNLRQQSSAAPAGLGASLGSGPYGTYLGNDFRAAYLPTTRLTGAGQKVGLLEFSSGYNQSDITAYETLAGISNVAVSAVLLDSYNGAEGSDNPEVSLDIEMAISMAPGLAGVLVYEGSTADDILDRMATDDLAAQLSASWNYSINATSDQIFQRFAAQGQSFFNSSGDGDAWVGAIAPPCDDTNITIVGGTTLATTGPGGGWFSENVWNWGYEPPGGNPTTNGFWGSGGGISTTHAIPPWQQGVSMAINGGSSVKRNVPDVALTADNIWVTYSNGLFASFGGTSCAAPLWAGFTALVNQQAVINGHSHVGFINPAIYDIGRGPDYTNCFHDTVSGNNCWSNSSTKFFAARGYDLCTGWGAPAGQELINALTPEALGVTPPSGMVASGPAGGPFGNFFRTFSLTNKSGASLSWSCVNTSSWLDVTPSIGILAPGQPAVPVSVSVNAAAADLPPGVYQATIWFTNRSDGIGQGVQNLLLANFTESPCTYGAALLMDQPAAYWRLDETIAPPAPDVVSNAGTLGFGANGFPFSSVAQGVPGIVNNCAAFSNSNLVVVLLGTHVDVPYNPVLNPHGPFTVEFWANPNQAPNDFFCPVSSIDNFENASAARFGWVFYETGTNQWALWLGNFNGYVAKLYGGALTLHAWQHVVGVYDGTNATLYVNGVRAAGPVSASGFAPNTNALVPLRIGATGLGNRTFDGSVDEVAVYTNALSPSAIYADYRAATTNNAKYGAQILASHPAGYWRLDEPAYTAVSPGLLPTAFNAGALAHLADGVCQPGAMPGVAGVPGSGFGGSNLACSFGATSYIDVPGGYLSFVGPLTLSAWIKALPGTGLVESVASMGATEYSLTLDALGHPGFADGLQSFGSVTGTNRLYDSQWHQLTGVYDGTNSQYLYVDGKLAGKATNAKVAAAVNDNDFWIGGDPDPGAFQFFNGAVDEVAIFTNALGPNQILWLYSSGFDATHLQAPASLLSAGPVTLTWAAIAGQSYSLEYCTNLAQANWRVLAGSLSATNSTVSFPDAPGTNSSRFYRVLLLP